MSSSGAIGSAVVDDEVIRHRLIYEGDSGLADRRIVQMIRTYLRYAEQVGSATFPSNESQLTLTRMLATIRQFELNAQKLRVVCEMNLAEQMQYQHQQAETDGALVKAGEQIGVLKEELVAARQVRSNRMEYDAICKLIDDQPSRASSEQEILNLNADVDRLEQRLAELDAAFGDTKNDFRLLLTAANMLQQRYADTDQQFGSVLSMEDHLSKDLSRSNSRPSSPGRSPSADGAGEAGPTKMETDS